MTISVVDAHPALYHYTTAAGLHGIVTSQQLRATNIAYLNDAEEHIGYFDRRLPRIVREALCSAVTSQRPNRGAAGDAQTVEKAIDAQTKNLVGLMRRISLDFNEPYVTSFSSVPPKIDEDDGVLSQWQGYGTDGGYAIVFETAPLGRLLEAEAARHHYQLALWGDVEYYNHLAEHSPVHPETIEKEQAIREALAESAFYHDEASYEKIFEPLTYLSCTHKHKGFHQEAEVRIVTVLTSESQIKAHSDLGGVKPRKVVHFMPRNGIIVPYINLFENKTSEEFPKLPIRKILVGPHRDKNMRKDAVRLLLDRHDVEAEVIVSDIPYIGR